MSAAPTALLAPPTFEQATEILRALGARHPNIARLEVFGSVAAGRAKPGSDLDVMITFRAGHSKGGGFAYFARLDDLADEMAAAVGVPVDLHTRAGAEQCPNPLRRASMLSGARPAYAA